MGVGMVNCFFTLEDIQIYQYIKQMYRLTENLINKINTHLLHFIHVNTFLH